jgi:hypothetical protein
VDVDWIQWGNLPQWLAAIGTAGGLFYALRLFRRESRARHEQDEDRLRDLAKYVAVWPNDLGTLTLRNGGQEPVYDVWIYASREEGLGAGDNLPVLYTIPLLPPVKVIDTGTKVPAPMGTQVFRLVFTDARGIRWVRESGGTLIRVDHGVDVGTVGAMNAVRKASKGRAFSPHYG